eukprot:PhM_4_TR14726/c0_g1_i1/m.78878/K17893/AOX1, AOX2; ubiquinol oxidase
MPRFTRTTLPVRGMTTAQHETCNIVHHVPTTPGDYFALGLVRVIRAIANMSYRDRYIHRCFPLVALGPALPLASAAAHQLRTTLSMRKYDDAFNERCLKLLEEAHNKQMHYATLCEFTSLTTGDRVLTTLAQFFCSCFFWLFSFLFPRVACRTLAYMAEEATVTLTHFVNDIDAGRIADIPTTTLCNEYWEMPPETTLRDAVLRMRTDVMVTRDWNHHLANQGW